MVESKSLIPLDDYLKKLHLYRQLSINSISIGIVVSVRGYVFEYAKTCCPLI